MKIGILHTAFIGDVILSSLLVEALSLAGHEIIYFTKKNTCVIFNYDLRVKKVIEIQKGKGFSKLFSVKKIAQQIDAEYLDILLVPHRSATSTLCAALCHVKCTVGFQNAALSFLYKKKAIFNQNKHECVRYLDLLKSTFSEQNNIICSENILQACEQLGRPILKYKKEAYTYFEKKFDSTNLTQTHLSSSVPFATVKKNFFILAVGSVWKTKKYPIEHWVDVAFEFLSKQPNYFCVLTGGPTDKEDIDNFINLFIGKSNKLKESQSLISQLINAAGLFSLSEFALFTSYAKFVLSNDSSPVHFASAFNIPIVAIFGPTIPEFGFAPTSSKSIVISYKDEMGLKLPCQPCSIHGKNVCPKGHHKCMKDLKPLKVNQVIQEIHLDK